MAAPGAATANSSSVGCRQEDSVPTANLAAAACHRRRERPPPPQPAATVQRRSQQLVALSHPCAGAHFRRAKRVAPEANCSSGRHPETLPPLLTPPPLLAGAAAGDRLDGMAARQRG